MSTLQVLVFPLIVEKHDNADALEIGLIGGYKSVIQKGQFKTGDLVAYIPCSSVLSDNLIEELGLTGRLAGSKTNRVKELKLRGVLSEGLLYPARSHWKEGDNVMDELEIVKYIPPIPTCLDGKVTSEYFEHAFAYDIENIKKYPTTFIDGEEVVITEKIHGSLMMVLCLPDDGYVTSSKRLSKQGLFFARAVENPGNTYNLMASNLNMSEVSKLACRDYNGSVHIIGEISGTGIQDLKYGCTNNGQQFHAFDVVVDGDNSPTLLNHDAFKVFCVKYNIPTVPELFRGPYSQQVVDQYTTGKETVSGKQAHIREGVVVKSIFKRKVLKSISKDYLLRKNGTEFD